MRLHLRHSLTYLPYCLVPLLLLAALNYWNGLRSVDTTLSALAQSHLNSLAWEINRRLEIERWALSRAALAKPLQDVMAIRRAGVPIALSNGTSDAPSIPADL